MTNDKEKEDKQLFIKQIEYEKEQPWRKDFIFGEKGSISHWHLCLSGGYSFSNIWYLRDELGKVLVSGGAVISF